MAGNGESDMMQWKSKADWCSVVWRESGWLCFIGMSALVRFCTVSALACTQPPDWSSSTANRSTGVSSSRTARVVASLQHVITIDAHTSHPSSANLWMVPSPCSRSSTACVFRGTWRVPSSWTMGNLINQCSVL